MSLPAHHPSSRRLHALNAGESGSHPPGFATYLATTPTADLPTSRRTNDGVVGTRAITTPPGIPAPSVPSAPSVPAAKCRTGTTGTLPITWTAWKGPPPAAAPPDASSSWTASSIRAQGPLIPTPTPVWPVASSGRPLKQRNTPQQIRHAPYQDAKKYTRTRCQLPTVTLTSPLNDPGVRLRRAPPLSNPNTNPGAFTPSIEGKTDQYAGATGSATAIRSQYLADMSTSFNPSNSTHRTPEVAQSIEENGSLALGLSVGLGFTPPLAGYIQNGSTHLCICNGDCWFVWCPLAWEHCNVAMNAPLPVIRLPCTCPSDSPMGQVSKGCSLVADHLFYLMHELTNQRASQFRGATASTSVTSSATHQNYSGAGSRGIAVENIELLSRETSESQGGRGTEAALYSEFSIPAPLFHATQPTFVSLPTHGTSASTQDTLQPSDVPESFDSHQRSLGGDLHSVPAVVGTVNPSDIVGPSGQKPVPQSGVTSASLYKRRKAPRNAVIPPAKRVRRGSQPSVPANSGTQVDATDEARGFADLDQQPEVQNAMRDLVGAIRGSQFLSDSKLEPIIGTHTAVALMAVAPSDVWHGYGTKAKSIYSLFIKVDEKECKCLWCGDVQQGKLQRAVGHFRAKHLGHEPFLCDEVHVVNQVCNVRFTTLEAMGEHKRRKDKLKSKGRLRCPGCDLSYISVSNLNRHREKCGSSQADPGRNDDE